MSHQKAVIVNTSEILSLATDAKVVAFRWDLIPWCLVLDADALMPERNGRIVRRAWIVFVGMSELTWSIQDARLPNGIFIVNDLVASEYSGGFYKYEVPVIAPRFNNAGELANNPRNRMTIRAKGILGAISIETCPYGEFGPDREQRLLLATDEDLLQALGNVWATVPDGGASQ